jgi:hypothetical protein
MCLGTSEAFAVWKHSKAPFSKLYSKGCSGRVNSSGYGNNGGDLGKAEWVTAEWSHKLFRACVKRIHQTGAGPMHAGWAQDRVSPLVKARLFVVQRDWYESPLWKLNKRSSDANPYTKASCQGKSPAFPENQGQVRQTSGIHAVKRTETTSGDSIYYRKVYQGTV